MSSILFRYMSIFGESRMLLSLAPLSVGTGLALLLLFRRFSNQASLRDTKRKLAAHLLEFRLYGGEPAALWRSCGAFAALNMRYLVLSLRPMLIAALPLALLLAQLEAVYGRRPLPVGEAAVITMQFKPSRGELPSAAAIKPPPGIAIESPPVRVGSQKQISWRLRPERELRGDLHLAVGEEIIRKEVQSGAMSAPISPRRSGSFLGMLVQPGEARFGSDAVAWVGISYPPRTLGSGSLRFHWLVWFCGISLLAAWLLRKRLGVVL